MNTNFRILTDTLEEDNKRIFNLISKLDNSQLTYTPESGRWSINQILVHLLVAERLSLAYMKKKSLGIETLENSGLRENFKSMLLTISQRIPLKYKAPETVKEQTPDIMTKDELITQFDEQLQSLRSFLETIEEKNIRKKIYKHPRVGMLNPMQGVHFFLEHRRHHQPQIDSLLKVMRAKK